MIYKIVEISTAKASGHTYVLVHFWQDKADFDAAKPPFHKNDFLMQLRPTGTKLTDPDDPGKGSVSFDRDVPAEIKANIEAYWARAEEKEYPADHTSTTIQRDNSDPHGVLARPDVVALKDTQAEKL